MRLLVVGASGFLGRHVLAEARRRGHEAVGTRTTKESTELVRFDLRGDRAADVMSLGDDLTAVICSAISQPERCAATPESRLVNVEGTLRVAEEVRSAGGRVVFLSTGFVFDGARGGYVEEDAPAPLNAYGRQKREVEEALVPRGALVARVDKLVGSEPKERHLFREWQDAIDAGRPILSLRGQVFSPTDVADAARALVVACERGISGLRHLAGPEHFAREDLARLYLEVTAQDAAVELRDAAGFEMTEPRPLKTWLDGSRFAAETGVAFTSMRDLARRFASKRV